ncbi:MAG: hypothetical protein PHU46_06095 [Rhodocyclaceae bacterium]|nr:hypothetical protein [Rhodocyclaceae bacterium]
MKFFRILFLFLAALLSGAGAHAAWWEFGRESNEPSITDLRFNSVDAARLDDMMVLGPEDLQNGVIVLRGQAQVGRGEIGLVEISLDNGKTWNAATLADRGLFTWEFRPELGRDYPFRVRAISTTGVSTGPEDHEFHLLVTATDGTAEAKATFRKLLDAYQAKDRSGFMKLVSNAFEGDASALDDALMNDFRWLDSIAIQTNITRVVSNSGLFELYFTYNRQVRSTRSGQFVKDSSASVVGFRRGTGGMKLVRMSAPLIFGVSDTGNVATSVTGQAVGQNVLTVDPYSGTANTQTQGNTATAAANSTTETGTKTVGPAQSYNFDTDSIANQDFNVMQGDIGSPNFPEAALLLRNGVTAKDIPCPISSTNSAPTGTYNLQSPLFGVQAGKCYALQLLPGPKYAIIEMISFTQTALGMTATFRYKYQPSGSRNF